ncbi:MAG: PAS domain-containing protein, partial [Euryarchaeota archaeon]|nr:PAS domain-containing protein [Euryarchaeota archaeon]
MGGDRAIDFVNKVKKKIVHVPICIAISDTGALYGKECLKNGIDYYIDDDGDEEFESLRLQSYIRQLCKNNQLQNAVEYAETNFETITEAIEDSIVMVDRHNRYLYMNAPHQMRLGVKDSSYKSKFYKDFHTIEENREFTRTMAHVFEINDYYSKEKEKDGRTYLLKYIPVKYPSSPQPLAVLIISSDITDRVRLERKLTESSSLLATTLESTSDGIFVADLSGKILTYNKKFLDLWAIPESIIEGRDEEVVAAYIEDQLIDRDGFLEQLKNLRENPERKAYDLLTFQDGRIFERLSQPQKMRDMIIGRTWSFRDVTEKRQISQNLNVTQANYKSLVESTGDPIFMVDEDGCYLFMNSHHQQLVGALA